MVKHLPGRGLYKLSSSGYKHYYQSSPGACEELSISCSDRESGEESEQLQSASNSSPPAGRQIPVEEL